MEVSTKKRFSRKAFYTRATSGRACYEFLYAPRSPSCITCPCLCDVQRRCFTCFVSCPVKARYVVHSLHLLRCVCACCFLLEAVALCSVFDLSIGCASLLPSHPQHGRKFLRMYKHSQPFLASHFRIYQSIVKEPEPIGFFKESALAISFRTFDISSFTVPLTHSLSHLPTFTKPKSKIS